MASINIWYNDRYCSKNFNSTILTRGYDLRVKIMDSVFMLFLVKVLSDLMMDLIHICMMIDIGPNISSVNL